MPFIKIIRKPHECYKPSSGKSNHRGNRRYDVGSVWMCEKCGQQWMIAEKMDIRNETVRYWRRMDANEFINPEGEK